ncbi:MAG: glycosyltransferase family 4 protein [Bacillota bacterium]
MKIAIFSDTFSPQINGVTKTLNKLISYFEENNVKYKIFAPETSHSIRDIHEKNIIRFKSMDCFLYSNLKIPVPNYSKAKKELAEFNPDLIHLVTPFSLGLVGLNYAKNKEIPFVASYHTNFNQYLDYYKIDIFKKAAWKYLRWFHNQAELNFCPSKSTLKNLDQQSFKNLKIWGRGVDTVRFNPEHRSSKLREELNLKNKITFLYVGRLAKEKNVGLIIKSFKKLQQKFNDKIKLVITGDGPEAESLKRKAGKGIIFTGFKNGQELAEIYASADIFTFASITETYGNVIIEAMASGLPVVAVGQGGVKENLLNKYNSLVCSKNDLNEFSSRLEKLVINEKLRRALSHNARQYSLTKSWKEIFKELLFDYKTIIENNRFKDYDSGLLETTEFKFA